MIFDIRDFGAVGDGKTMNTSAFAAAIQAAQGHGDAHNVILVANGTYLTGTIALASNMTLRVEAGATILGSPDIADYSEFSAFQSRLFQGVEGTSHWGLTHYLVGAQHAENVFVEGDGVIDGNGHAFWEDVCRDGKPWLDNHPALPVGYRVLKSREPRPAALSFWKCTNLVVRDIHIVNSPSYTIWPQGCDRVRITDVTIDNPACGPNTDALDIDCSRNVFISGCNIAAGDDCIALKSDTSRLDDTARANGDVLACEFITVANCILTTTCCAVRIGYEGDGPIRDCVFSNLVIHDARHAIDMLSLTPTPRPDFLTGTPIERIAFSNIVARNVSDLFFIWCGSQTEERPYRAHVRNLTFSSIDAHVRAGSFIGSKDGAPVENVTLRDVRIQLQEHPVFKDQTPADYPGLWGNGYKPDALWLHRAANVQLFNVSCTSDSAIGKCLRWDDVANLVKDGALMPENGRL